MKLTNSFKSQLFDINIETFPEKALQLFRYQAKENKVYGNYLQSLKVSPDQISDISNIPFLPISFFKSHKVVLENLETEVQFYSSGTTGTSRSTHYVYDLEFYKTNSVRVFEHFYGSLHEYIILAYLPSYLENPSSSLIHMINHFFKMTESAISGFVTTEVELTAKAYEAKKSGKKVCLFGVTYALMDLAEKNFDLNGIIIVETGGMKGRRKEITREELHNILREGLNTDQIHSEYGMTELLSQAYSQGHGIFRTPPWMQVFTREINDPFSDNTGLRSGLLKIIDLANIHSCAFIETEDIGSVDVNGGFTVLGRMDNSESRGCNLMYTL